MNTLIVCLVWFLLGCIASYNAAKRGRDPRLWFLLGLFLGLLGVIVLFILPKKVPPPKKEEIAPVLPPQRPLNPALNKAWFYVDSQRQKQGPLYFFDFEKAWVGGEVQKETLVWCEGMNEWKRAGDLPDLLKELF